jgi:hypothetical protein
MQHPIGKEVGEAISVPFISSFLLSDGRLNNKQILLLLRGKGTTLSDDDQNYTANLFCGY